MNKISVKVNQLLNETYPNITISEKLKLITFCEKYTLIINENKKKGGKNGS